MITLFEVDHGRLAIEKGGVLGEIEIPDNWEINGFSGLSFEHDARNWAADNWEPQAFDNDKLFRRKSPVATWSPDDGLFLLRRRVEILPMSQAYIGEG